MTSFSGTTPTDAVELQKLIASDLASTDNFGHSVALSADGLIAIVGAPQKNGYEGAAYVFTRSGGTWTQQQKLTVVDPGDSGNFGVSVAISLNGSTLLVGASSESTSPESVNGAAYVFTSTGSTWTQQQKLLASDFSSFEEFGNSVALSADGNTAIIGAFMDNTDAVLEHGSAYVFIRSAGVWSQQAKLLSSDIAANDRLGISVALSSDGNTAIVGAYQETTSPNSNQGAAYVFTRSSSTWTQQAKLLASDRANTDYFGWSVALSADGDTAIVGARIEDESPNSNNGAAYVFTRSSSTWTQQAKLLASDRANTDYFGWSVSISGDGNTALIGAYIEDTSPNTDQGAAYLFTRSGSTWTQQQKILASDRADIDRFGHSVELSADGLTAIVGAILEDTSPNTDNGAAYIYALGRTLDNKLYAYDSTLGAWDVSAFGELLAPTFNYYTSSGSFTIPTGAKVLNVVVIGAGGGGGGGARNVVNNGGGGGGGGGGFSERMFSAFELGGAGTVISYTVGSGGTGGTVTATGTTALSGNAGGAGGDSSFGTFLVAKGGGAGRTGANGVDNGGGVGGSGMWIGNSSGPAYEASPTSIYAGGGAGGNGGYQFVNNMLGAGISACTSLTAATTASQAGSSNTSYNAPAGGGAGATSSTTTPSVGGAGGLPGGGGGGGGEGSTGGASGAGGAGGAGGGGLVAITVWYG